MRCKDTFFMLICQIFFVLLWQIQNSLMKNHLSPSTALYGVYAGVLLLALCHVTGWNRINALLFTALSLIVLGIIGYVLTQRRQGKY